MLRRQAWRIAGSRREIEEYGMLRRRWSRSEGPVLNRQIGDAAEFAFIVGDKRKAELQKRLLGSFHGLPTFDVFGWRIDPTVGKKIL